LASFVTSVPSTNGKEVGLIGFSLMAFIWRANPCSQDQAFEALRTALENGCTYWDPNLTVWSPALFEPEANAG
jgi:hypothetical protein